jgi:hypothetical protein
LKPIRGNRCLAKAIQEREQNMNDFAGRRPPDRSTDPPRRANHLARREPPTMPTAMTAAEFAEWEPRQPVRFALVDGRPMRLPEADQGPARIARVRQVAAKILASPEAVDAWMLSPQAILGGLEPEAVAADGEEGCQLVLRTLVTMARLREASLG